MRQRGSCHGTGSADFRLTAAFRSGDIGAYRRDLSEACGDIQCLQDHLCVQLLLFCQREQNGGEHAAASGSRCCDNAFHTGVAFRDFEGFFYDAEKIRAADERARLCRQTQLFRIAADKSAVGAVGRAILLARLLHRLPKRLNLPMRRLFGIIVFLTIILADDGVQRLISRFCSFQHGSNTGKAHDGSS